MPPQINVVSAYAYVVEEFLERTALWGYVNEATGFGNMICIKNVGAVAYNTSKCNDGTSLRCSACAFAPCCKMSKKALVLSDFIKTL